MSRISNLLTTKAYGERVAAGKEGILNLSVGGQQGYLADMASVPSSTDHVKMPLIVKVLRAPAGLSKMGPEYVHAYKNMIENMMQSWQGFNRTLSVSVNETQTGHSGEVFQTPTRVSRARSQITSTIVEKDRRPILRFLEDVTRFTIGDPEVGHPLLSNYEQGLEITDRLADIYSGIIIAYEPDKTFRYVDNAYLITNFFPYNDIGENTSSRQLQQDGEVPTYNLSWTGFQKVGYKVDELAQSFMDSNRVIGLDPSGINLIADGIDSNVDSTAVSTGFTEQIESLKQAMKAPASRS